MPEQLLKILKINFEKSKKRLWPWKLSKFTLLEDQNLTIHFDFGDHISTFRAENKRKRCPFKAKKQCLNNFWTTPKQLSKSQKNDFFDLANCQNCPLRRPKFDPKFWFFVGHISPFRAENVLNISAYKSENNA